MSECHEQQIEELEVLRSIYEGDSNFKEISSTCFQYKYGVEDNKSFFLEITWPDMYPNILPSINLDVFYNKHLPSNFKEEIKHRLLKQAEPLLGSAMTFSLLDWMREESAEFLNRIPEFYMNSERVADEDEETFADSICLSTQKKDKKEQLTKAQKRRITERTNYKGERERGWNWVDVVRHLSQTGTGI